MTGVANVTLLASKRCSCLVTLANCFALGPVASVRVVDRKGMPPA